MRHLKPEFFFTTYQMIMLSLNIIINFLPNFFWVEFDAFGPRDFSVTGWVALAALFPRVWRFCATAYFAMMKMNLRDDSHNWFHFLTFGVNIAFMIAMLVLRYLIIG